MSEHWRVLVVSLSLSCSLVSSGDEPQPVSLSPTDGLGTYWIQRSDEQLAVELASRCRDAQQTGQSLLLWFSAAWCLDCRRHLAHEKTGVLDDELLHWQRVVIEPGRFERHKPLLSHFQVSAIPFGVVVRPDDCDAPATEWRVVDSGRFDRPLIDGDTARFRAWLEKLRTE